MGRPAELVLKGGDTQGDTEEVDGVARPGKPTTKDLQPLYGSKAGKYSKERALIFSALLMAGKEIAEEVGCHGARAKRRNGE